jgi:phospholipid/cholesterol/gamma-HCH transport system ATP-binding protein
MVPLPKGQTDPRTSSLMLGEGRLVIEGALHDLLHTEDAFVHEFLV